MMSAMFMVQQFGNAGTERGVDTFENTEPNVLVSEWARTYLKAVCSDLNGGRVFMPVHLKGIVIPYVFHVTSDPVTWGWAGMEGERWGCLWGGDGFSSHMVAIGHIWMEEVGVGTVWERGGGERTHESQLRNDLASLVSLYPKNNK